MKTQQFESLTHPLTRMVLTSIVQPGRLRSSRMMPNKCRKEKCSVNQLF
jgi:hypothetical protein